MLKYKIFQDFKNQTNEVAAAIAGQNFTAEQIADLMFDTMTAATMSRGDSLYPTYLAAAKELISTTEPISEL